MLSRVMVIVLSVVAVLTLSAGAADARSFRLSGGYTGQHTHWTWAGPGVGLVAWTVATDFSSFTPCGSSTAGVTVDAAWNSESLHNGAQLDILFPPSAAMVDTSSWVRYSGSPKRPCDLVTRHSVASFTSACTRPGGRILKSGTMTTWIMNGGVAYGLGSTDTVRFSQHTKSC